MPACGQHHKGCSIPFWGGQSGVLPTQAALLRTDWHSGVMRLPHGGMLCVLQLTFCGAQKPICHAAPAAGPFSTLNQLWAPAGGNGVQLPLGRYTAGEAAHQTLPALLGQVCAAWFRPCSVQPPVLQGAPLGSARCLQRRLACSSIPMHREARHAQPALQSTIVTGGGCTWAAMSCSGHTGLAVDSA